MELLSGVLKQTSWFEKSRAPHFWAGFGAPINDALRLFTRHAPRFTHNALDMDAHYARTHAVYAHRRRYHYELC